METSGITASDLAEVLDIMRSNVSSELNELVREKRVIKFVTRPVLYVPAELIRSQFGDVVREYEVKAASLKELLNQENTHDKMRIPFHILLVQIKA